MKQPPGHGFIQPEIETGVDYVFGAYSNLGGEIINESGDWTAWLPSGEAQAPRFETNACTCFGTSNAVETLVNFIFGNTTNLSDRMVAKGAGVDPKRGAVPKAAADFIRKNWAVQEGEWPMEGVQTVEEYYKELPAVLYTIAKEDKADYELGYEYVTPSPDQLREALKRGTVCMSVALWLGEDGKYYRPTGWADSHWIMLVKIYENGDMLVLDSYAPYLKTIKAGFLPQTAYRYTLNEKQVDSILISIAKIIKTIQAWLATQKATPPIETQPTRLEVWAKAIQAEESSKPPRVTDVNVRLKNPGNLKYTSYTASLGGKKSTVPGLDGGTFCEFPTYTDGLNALKQFLRDAVDGKLKSYKPTDTLKKGTQTYANPPNLGYATNVAKKLGVTIETQIREILK